MRIRSIGYAGTDAPPMRATDPYREDPEKPLVHYAIRSSAPFAVLLGFTALLALATAWLGLGSVARADATSEYILAAVLLGIGPLLFAAMWSSRKTYLVAGGRGTIRLFADRVEIADGDGDHLIAAAHMRTEEIRHRARIWFGFIPVTTHETDRHIRLQSPGRNFQLSRRLFERHEMYDAFCRDLERLVRGQLDQPAPPPAAPPDEDHTDDHAYRQRLAYELDHVDDV